MSGNGNRPFKAHEQAHEPSVPAPNRARHACRPGCRLTPARTNRRPNPGIFRRVARPRSRSPPVPGDRDIGPIRRGSHLTGTRALPGAGPAPAAVSPRAGPARPYGRGSRRSPPGPRYSRSPGPGPRTLARSSRPGGSSTTRSGPTARSATSPRRSSSRRIASEPERQYL